MSKLALNIVIGGVIASSFNSSMNSSVKSISQIGSQIKKMNKEKIDIKRFKELKKNTQGSRKEFIKLGRSLKKSGHDLTNFSKHTKTLNTDLLKLKKNLIIKGKIKLEKGKLFEQRDSLLATFGTAVAIGGVINLRSEVLAAQGELRSLKIGDIGIKAITQEAKDFSNTFAGTTAPEFIKASYDIKSGISSLGDVAVGKFTRLAAITAGATKSTTTQMTSFFATGYGIYSKQFDLFSSRTVKGWSKLSQEEKDIKFGEAFASGIGSAVQMFKTDGTKMQNAIETLGASATTSNVPLAEQLAILGQMQKSFASGSEAATAYKGFLTGAVAAQEKLGLEFLDSNNQLKSAPLILEQLRTKYGETLDDMEKQELKEAFGTEEGIKFITAYYCEVDELKENINKMSSSMKNGTKSVNDMMNATQEGKGFALVGQQISNLGATIGKVFYPAASMMGNILGSIAIGLDTLINTFPMVASGIGYLTIGIFSYVAISKTARLVSFAHKVSMLALRGSFLANIPVLRALRLSINRTSIATVGSTIKTKALSLWTGILGAKQKVAAIASGIFRFAMIGVNFALAANPIGLVVVAIGALVGGLIWAYNKCDWFRTGVNNAWETIKTVFSFSPMALVTESYGKVFDWLGSKFDWFGKSMSKLKGMGSSVKNFFGLGNETESENTKVSSTKMKIGNTLKKVTAATIATTQLAVAQPNLNYTSLPKTSPGVKKEIQQVNHIKVTVINPTSTVDVEKGISNALLSSGHSLNDEEI